MDKYEKLIFESNLYPPKFITKYGTDSVHWTRDSWVQKEMSLRHDSLCCLLCNMTHRAKALHYSPPSKKAKLETPSTSCSFSPEPDENSNSAGSSDETYDVSNWQEPESDEEDEELPETSNRPRRENRYRFTMLEGRAEADTIMNRYARKWEINPPTNRWDLVDRDNKCFVEVKVGTSLTNATEQYFANSVNLAGHTSLYWINPNSLDSCWKDHSGGVPGEHKVKSFLTIRKAAMERLGIVESDLHEVYDCLIDLSDSIFVNDRFNNSVEEWFNPTWERRFEEDPPHFNPLTTTAKAIYPSDLLSVLEDPREREGAPTVTWQGKVIPPFWCSPLLTSEAEDSDMVELFLNDLEGLDSSTEAEEIISIVIRAWKAQHPRSTFQFIKKRELLTVDPSGILGKWLGINRKGAIRDDDDQTTQQKEGSEHERSRYHPWFDCLLEELAMPNEEHGSHFPGLLEEPVPSDHPMDELVLKATHELFSIFSKSRAASYANKIVNLYSRLGGSYLGDHHGNSNHSSFSIFPLYCVSTDEVGVSTRRIDGVCIRAPHHAVKTTDKVQFLTLERVTTDPNIVPYLDHIKKSHF